MIRKGRLDFNSFPATIALEKVEAKTLFTPTPKRSVESFHNSFSCLSHCQGKLSVDDKFPKIEWEEDDVNSAYEERLQGICSFGADCTEVLIRSAKRRKLTSEFLSKIRSRKDEKGLTRTQRILTKLDLLDHGVEDYHAAPILVTNTTISRPQSVPSIRGPQFSSLGDCCNDPNMEKLLQMSFYDDGGDYQVTIIA